jgi:hypothetical protein
MLPSLLCGFHLRGFDECSALLAGIVLFGTGFGNATSMPTLVAQREFVERDVAAGGRANDRDQPRRLAGSMAATIAHRGRPAGAAMVFVPFRQTDVSHCDGFKMALRRPWALVQADRHGRAARPAASVVVIDDLDQHAGMAGHVERASAAQVAGRRASRSYIVRSGWQAAAPDPFGR